MALLKMGGITYCAIDTPDDVDDVGDVGDELFVEPLLGKRFGRVVIARHAAGERWNRQRA